MAHEIYYTSAAEGLRQGDRGFCTVAATAGIPRRLWERLEALSGYRHHFDTSTRPGANPVCHAHWLLNVDGRDYHVLSRICDAGLDYSQRSNALAHHLVLESSELAAAGPAWLLAHGDVMKTSWDGRVGEIARLAPLPKGDLSPAPCQQWQRLCGDAGWAGVLAHTVVSSARRPVCLLFNHDQDLLPLVNEAIALLPASLRWQATFNTYFTSLPGGVSCQWRCCLAGTPAAASAIRLASSGLIIDLTRPDAMGAAPDDAWVAAARAGNSVPTAAAATVPAAKPKPRSWRAAPKVAAAQSSPVPTPPEPIELAPEKPAAPVTQQEVIARDAEETPALPPQPEVSWGEEMRKLRRRRLMAIYAIACVAIGAGVWLQTWASRSSSSRPLPLPPPPAPATPPAAVTPVNPPPAPPALSVEPQTPQNPVEVKPPAPVAPAPAPVAPRPAPATIVLDSPLPPPKAGSGIRDISRSVNLPRERVENMEGIVSLSLTLPGKGRFFLFRTKDLTGVFAVTPTGTQDRPSVVLEWLDSGQPTSSTPVVTVSLDRSGPRLEFTWRTAVMLSRPQLVSLAYWVLQNSAVVVNDLGGERPQGIQFAALSMKSTSLLEPRFDPAWPGDLPVAEQLSLGQVTPAGWKGTAAAEGAVQALRVEKVVDAAGGSAAFTIRFSIAGRLMSCDLKQASASASDAIAAADTQIKQADEELQDSRKSFLPNLTELDERLAETKLAQARNAANPQPGDMTPEQYRDQIDRLSKAKQELQAELERASAPAAKKRQEASSRRELCVRQLAAFAELKELEVIVELLPGVRVGSVRLVRE